MLNIEAIAARKPIGQGAFSNVHPVGLVGAQVLVIARVPGIDNEKYGYLALCAKRLKVFGLRSEEMRGLPEVFETGTSKGRNFAIVRRYAETLRDRETRLGRDRYFTLASRLSTQWSETHKDLHVSTWDAHSGNWMYCPIRSQYVLIDPCTGTDQRTHCRAQVGAIDVQTLGTYGCLILCNNRNSGGLTWSRRSQLVVMTATQAGRPTPSSNLPCFMA